MECSVFRNSKGEVVEVKAPNNKASILYNHLFQKIGDKEKALQAWAQVYTPSFKRSFGDWELLNEAKELGKDMPGIYRGLMESDPEEVLYELAKQYHSSELEGKGAVNQFGIDLIAIADKLYPEAKNGEDNKPIFTNKLDENGEPKVSEIPLSGFLQLSTTPSSVASKDTLGKIKEFLDRIGVKVQSVQDIMVDGERIGANGVARILNSLIAVVEGKEDQALPEEAMHFAVELIEQKNPELFKAMLNKIGTYKLFDQVLQDYKDVYKTPDGKPDIPKIKKEAIAQALAEHVIYANEKSQESAERILQTRAWWQRFIDWFKSLYNKAGVKPFEVTAKKILKGTEELGNAADVVKNETFLQLSNDLASRLLANHQKVGKDASGKYTFGSDQVKGSVESIINHFYEEKRRNKNISEDDLQRARREYKEATAGKGSQDIADILERYIGDDNKLRPVPKPPVNPSALQPNKREYYNTLEKNISQRLNTYPAGTIFMHNVNLYDSKRGIVGNANLLAINPNTSKVDIIQFKFPNVSKGDTALRTYESVAYDREVEELRKILENGYGLTREDFNLTRTIPVRAYYSSIDRSDPKKGLKLVNVKIGKVDVALEKDDTLLPISSESEETGDEELDKLIHQLRAILKNLQDQKVDPSEADQKGTKIAALTAAITTLKVRRDATKLFKIAHTLVQASTQAFDSLTSRVNGAVIEELTIPDIAKLSAEALEAKSNLAAYKDLDVVFDEIYKEDTEDNEKFKEDADIVASKARRLIKGIEKLEDTIRMKLLAAKTGIKDTLNPEKELTWYRKMIRSLSQSSINAGKQLWGIVKNINQRLQITFDEKMEVLNKHSKDVREWASKNGGMKEVYNKIFSFDEKGRWRGRFISRTSSEFYENLAGAKERGDLEWIKENVDVEGYQKWYDKVHESLVEKAKTLRLNPDDEVNEKMVAKSLKDWENKYDITKKSAITATNYVLNGFPQSDKWASKEFKALNEKGNEPLLELYNYWQKTLEKSHELGLIANWERRTFFPNIRKEYLEKLSTVGSRASITESVLDGLRIENEDEAFGKQDALTGEPIDNVHAAYVYDLGKEANDTAGGYFMDYSDKSMDLFKVMALWERELIRFELRTETEAIAKLLVSTESRKKALKVNKVGNIVKDKGVAVVKDNTTNTKYIKDFVDAIYYGKRLSDEFDVTFSVPYKSAVEKINKLFGREVLPVPHEENITISGVKALQSFNRYFLLKTLGGNPLTALSQLWGGTANAYINSGKYFTKTELLANQTKMISGRFYDARGTKEAALMQYFIPLLEDRTYEEANELSVNKAVKIFSSEWLMVMQRQADKGVQYPIAMSFIENTVIRDGKFVNIRELVKKEMGYDSIYKLSPEDRKAKKAAIEDRIKELKEKESLLNIAQVVDDKLVIPGIERNSQPVYDFRQKIQEFTKDALGNTSQEDLSLYKRSVMMQSFFMFKNWIPRMLDVRGQSLKYNAGTEGYEWGRIRMLARALQTNGLGTVASLFKQLSGNEKDIIKIAQKLFKEKQEYFASQNEEFNMTEADFVDMYLKGVRSEFKELGLTLGLLGLLIFARIHAPGDDDPQVKGMYKWTLRSIDKLTDELSFFYDPTSFTNIANGSIFPAVGILVDAETLMKNGLKDAYYYMSGDKEGQGKIKSTKYFFKSIPLVNQLVQYGAIFNNDFAKEMGIQISAQNGRR